MTRGVVPDFDPQAERWGFNRLMFSRFAGQFDDWHRWFDLHSTEHIQKHRPDAYRWYQQQRKPIYRWEPDSALPSGCVYPRERVSDATERNFACSLSWLLALAIAEKFEHIDIFWCPFDGTDNRHVEQVRSASYWIGRARGAGRIVTIHGDSALNPTGPLYGCEYLDEVFA
jgi:hypothetical protein